MIFYQENPFPEDLEDRLHSINNELATINKYVRDIKRNLMGLYTIAEKNINLDLSRDIQELESKLAEIAGVIAESGLHKQFTSIKGKLKHLDDHYTTHEAIRRQRRSEYIMTASYPPWDVIYDKVAGLDGDIHVMGPEISSFIIPPQYQQEFLDFVESLPSFQYQGPAPKVINSFLIRYRPAISRY